MKTPRETEQLLADLAWAITDGSDVDWQAVRPAQTGMPAVFANLQAVHRLAQVCQSSQRPRLRQAPRPLHARAGKDAKLSVDRDSRSEQDSLKSDRAPLFVWGPLFALERIGVGGFGEVYRAYDPRLQLDVALKLGSCDALDDVSVQRFLSEARALAKVRHRNVLTIHGADVHAGRAGLWTELVDGKTLADIVHEQGVYGAEEATHVAIELCGALAALHARGLVHRDLKPANVMREDGGRLVLMDFGAVGSLDRATPLTAAPEMLLGTGAPKPACDIYGLGVLLYWLVSGCHPVVANDLPELCQKHRLGERRPLLDLRPDLPRGFVQVVERAISFDPARRFATIGEMQQSLQALTGPATNTADESGRRSWALRWRPLVLGTAAVGCLLALGSIVMVASRAGSFQVEATLYRKTEEGTSRLLNGATIRPGDGLSLELQGSQSMYVYVVAEDDAGPANVLFPAPTSLRNPLAAGLRHRLPGKRQGEDYSWVVTSRARRETILIIASTKALGDVESLLGRFQKALPERRVATGETAMPPGTAAKPAEDADPERGIGGMRTETARPAGEASDDLAQLARLVVEKATHSNSVWLQQIQLRY